MQKLLRTTAIVICALCLAGFENPAASDLSDQVREFLRNRIETAGIPARVGEELIHASAMLPRFYERRGYRPAWSDNDGPLSLVEALIRVIQTADLEGLDPADYHLAKVETVLAEISQSQRGKKPVSPRRLVDLDLLLTDAFLIYASHLLAGSVNPETFDPEWHANRREADLATVLERTLTSGQIEEELGNFLPPQPGYAGLRKALASYRDLASRGGWPMVPDGPKLQRGDTGERVTALCRRLRVSGDYSRQVNSDEALFDELLESAVRRFQQRHALEVDGVVGPGTLAVLNIPVEKRIRQIEVNMERWRWLPQDLGKFYLLVNIAGFQLDLVEDGQSVLVMRVIVGQGYRRTPVFSEKMTYLVLCPSWHVPPNIAIQDKLPLIRKDPNYLVKQHMRVFHDWGADAREIDPGTIDWSTVTAENFTHRLRQDPGPWNALGPVKFMFPNKFNVYLHGTPSQQLFAKTTRAFSSGCIRLEKPIDLAAYVLQKDPKWTEERIQAAIQENVEQTVQLPEPIPVHLLYWTVWVDGDGSLQFREDIYGRDTLLDRALANKNSASHSPVDASASSSKR